MKIYEYRPEMIKDLEGNDVKTPFTGVVEIQIPTYKERIQLVKSLDVFNKAAEQIDQGIKMIELVEKHVKKVDLKHGNEKFTSIDELGYSKEGTELINNIGTIIVQGIPLGNG